MAADDILVASPVTGTGGILTAATGTALPDSTSASTSAFTANGLIGDGGVEMTIDRQTIDLFAFGGSKVRVIQTEHSVQLAFEYLEINPTNLPLLFGTDNVTTSGSLTTIKLNSATLPHFALVIDTADGDKAARITAADAQIVQQGPITFSHADAARFPVTIELFEDGSGDKATILYDTGESSS